MFKKRLLKLSLFSLIVLVGLSFSPTGFVGNARAGTVKGFDNDPKAGWKKALDLCQQAIDYGLCKGKCVTGTKDVEFGYKWSYTEAQCNSNCSLFYASSFFGYKTYSYDHEVLCNDWNVDLVQNFTPKLLWTAINTILEAANKLVNSVAVAFFKLVDVFVDLIFLDETGPPPASTIVPKVKPVLIDVWQGMRNIVNFFFLGVLIFVAFVNIIGANKWWNQAAYTIKAYLPKFAFAVIAVNFSWLMCMFLLDQWRILMYATQNLIKTTKAFDAMNNTNPTFVNLVESFRLEITSFVITGMEVWQIIMFKQVIMALFMNIIFVVFGGILLVVFAFAMIKGWLLIAISPIIWVGFLIDKLKGDLWTKWWSHFLSIVTIGFKITLVLYIGTMVLNNIMGAFDTSGDDEAMKLLLYEWPWWVEMVLKLLLTVVILSIGIGIIVKSDEHTAKAIGIGKKIGGAAATALGTLPLAAAGFGMKALPKAVKGLGAEKRAKIKWLMDSKWLTKQQAKDSLKDKKHKRREKDEILRLKANGEDKDSRGVVLSDDDLKAKAEKNVKSWSWKGRRIKESIKWHSETDNVWAKLSGSKNIATAIKWFDDKDISKWKSSGEMVKGVGKALLAWVLLSWNIGALASGVASLPGISAIPGSQLGAQAVGAVAHWAVPILKSGAVVAWGSALAGGATAGVGAGLLATKKSAKKGIDSVGRGTRAMMEGDQQLGEYRQGAGTVHYNRAALNKHFVDKNGKALRDTSGNVVGLSNNEKSNEKAMQLLHEEYKDVKDPKDNKFEQLTKQMTRVKQHEVSHRVFNENLDEEGQNKMVSVLNSSKNEEWANFQNEAENKDKSHKEMADEFLAQVVSGEQKIDDKLQAGICQTIAQNMQSQGVDVDMSFDDNLSLGDKLEAVDAHLAPDEKVHAVFDNLGSPKKTEKEDYEKAKGSYKQVKNDYETAQRVDANKNELLKQTTEHEQLMNDLTTNKNIDELDKEILAEKLKQKKKELQETIENLNKDTGHFINPTDYEGAKSFYGDVTKLEVEKKRLKELKKEKEGKEDVIDRYESDYGAYMQTEDLVKGWIAHQQRINNVVGTEGGASFKTTHALIENQEELIKTLLDLQKTIASLQAQGLKVENNNENKGDASEKGLLGKFGELLSDKMNKKFGINTAEIMKASWLKNKMGVLSKGYIGTMMKRKMGLDTVHNQLKIAQNQSKQFNQMISELGRLEKDVKSGAMTEQQAVAHLEGRLNSIWGNHSTTNENIVNKNITNETVVNREVNSE